MNEKERLNALEIALNNEMRERAFYLRHAARTKNPVGKAMFQQIGDEELEHYERLKELHAKWEKQEKWPETLPLQVKDTVVKNLLLDSVKGVDVKSGGDDDDLEAIRIAIEFEAKGARVTKCSGTAFRTRRKRSSSPFWRRLRTSTICPSRTWKSS